MRSVTLKTRRKKGYIHVDEKKKVLQKEDLGILTGFNWFLIRFSERQQTYIYIFAFNEKKEFRNELSNYGRTPEENMIFKVSD